MKNNRAPLFVVVVTVAGVLNLLAYGMDRSWLGKESIKLAIGIVGGMCLGAARLALYQRIKYSEMCYVTKGLADMAEGVQSLGGGALLTRKQVNMIKIRYKIF